MIQRSNLPDEIKLPTGETLKCVIGGHLENKPFLTVEHSVTSRTSEGGTAPANVSAAVAEARRRFLG